MVDFQRGRDTGPGLEFYLASDYRRGKGGSREEERWLFDSDFSVHVSVGESVGDRTNKAAG